MRSSFLVGQLPSLRFGLRIGWRFGGITPPDQYEGLEGTDETGTVQIRRSRGLCIAVSTQLHAIPILAVASDGAIESRRPCGDNKLEFTTRPRQTRS
jgi:hypothetical protein